MAKTLRAPKLDLTIVLTSQNPHIDLRLEPYEVSTRNFLRAVSNYTQRAITEISNRKTVHVSSRKKFLERLQQIEAETNQCKMKEIELIKVLSREQEEKRDAESSVASFKRQLSTVKEKCALLDAEVNQHRILAANMDRERNREQSLLDSYAIKVIPELVGFETKLQCQIEGIEKDKILIRFLHMDPIDSMREFSIVLDVTNRSYRVPTMTPVLPSLPILLENLNHSRSIYVFIKDVRNALLDMIGRSSAEM